MSIDYIKGLLESKGIKPSIQRISILNYIIEKRNHPSVDMIFRELVPQIPTLSRTTVYNTLNMFRDEGIINALTIDNVELKYDYEEIPHAHFRCKTCNNIYDVKLNTVAIDDQIPDNHQITEMQINLTGICNRCIH